MPQEIRVLKCFQCLVYQTDIVKKAKKWECKLCGTKQSLLQEFCRGTGKVCREYAQKLNHKSKSQDESLLEHALILEEKLNESIGNNVNDIENNFTTQDENDTPASKKLKLQSKWAAYVQNNEASDEDDNIFK